MLYYVVHTMPKEFTYAPTMFQLDIYGLYFIHLDVYGVVQQASDLGSWSFQLEETS
jgi:hypothetical protein